MDQKEANDQSTSLVSFIVIGGKAFPASEVLNHENNPEIQAHMDAWMAKKAKSFELKERNAKKRKTQRRK
jgi:hypothetical protein